MPSDKNNAKKNARPQTRHLKPIKPGEVRNPNGRPKGRRDAKTVIWEAMQKIAAARNMTAEEIETTLQQVGLSQAMKGNHQFYQSINDRLYGKVKETTKVEMNVTEVVNPEVKRLTKMLNDLHRGTDS